MDASPPALPTADELFARARAAAVARAEHLPPYIDYHLDASFERKGRTFRVHYHNILRTSDGTEWEQRVPDSARDIIDTKPSVSPAATIAYPITTTFDLRPKRPGEKEPGFALLGPPAPEPSASAGIATIGHVTATARTYDVTLAGQERIGDALVWHLRLVPRFDPNHHLLRDVYLRVDDGEPVRIIIGFNGGVGPVRARPSVTIDYQRFGDTWLISDAGTSFALRMAFFSLGGTLTAHISNVTFPASEPDWMFDSKALAEHLKASGT